MSEQRQQCDMCGTIDYVRPYGPNGEVVCYRCGMKDPVSCMRAFLRQAGIENPSPELIKGMLARETKLVVSPDQFTRLKEGNPRWA